MDKKIDKSAIAEGFSKSALTYDNWNIGHKEIGRKLLAMLPKGFQAKTILDIGCGTGFLSYSLHKIFPNAEIIGIDIAKGMIDFCKNNYKGIKNLDFQIADAENFLPEKCFDIIASNTSIQWLHNPEIFLYNLSKILGKSGIFLLSVFIHDSFKEFFNSYKAVRNTLPGNYIFKKKKFYQKIINDSKLKLLNENEFSHIEYLGNSIDMLKFFKGLGAVFTNLKDYSPLSVTEIKSLIDYYEKNYKTEKGLPLTFTSYNFCLEKNFE